MSFDNLMSMCRGCLAADHKMVSATLYESEFKELTGITISPSDGLPEWLCDECVALLHKCIKFRNKVMKSHYTLCQYALERVAIPHDKDDDNTSVSPTSTKHDVPGTQTEQLEDPAKEPVAKEIDASVTVKVESVKVEDEAALSKTDDKIITIKDSEECPVIDEILARACSSISELDTMDVLAWSDEEQTNQGKVQEKTMGVNNADIETVEIKDESSNSYYDDDFTIEECCIDELIESRSKSLTRKADYNKQTELEEATCSVVRSKSKVAANELSDEDSDEEIDVVSINTPDVLPPIPTHDNDRPLRLHTVRPHHQSQPAADLPTRRSSRTTVQKRSIPSPSLPVKARRQKRGSVRRRRVNIDSDSDISLERQTHNDMERQRRSGLRSLFNILQQQIPATRDKQRTPKIVILREATVLCRKFNEQNLEREMLKKKQLQLWTKLKKLRASKRVRTSRFT